MILALRRVSFETRTGSGAEQIRMGSGAAQDQFARVFSDAVDQQPVRLEGTLAPPLPFPRQGVVTVSRRQRSALPQGVDHRQEAVHVLTPLAVSLGVLVKPGGGDDGEGGR